MYWLQLLGLHVEKKEHDVLGRAQREKAAIIKPTYLREPRHASPRSVVCLLGVLGCRWPLQQVLLELRLSRRLLRHEPLLFPAQQACARAHKRVYRLCVGEVVCQ